MKLVLSEYGVKNLINELEYLSDTIETTSGFIVDKLVAKGIAKAIELNAAAPKSGIEDNIIRGEYAKDKTAGSIVMEGPNAVYDEFGTGEEGATDPHPIKGQFGLNPYNSGPFVSTHINPETGRHYWYYPPMGGRPYYNNDGYTEGIPSGKQMYNTLRYIQSEKNNVIKQELEDALRVFKK